MARVKKFHSALKHGGYVKVAVLPGEDQDAFNQLHQGLIAELAPSGALEEGIVAQIARLLWRQLHLATIHAAERARKRDPADPMAEHAAIMAEHDEIKRQLLEAVRRAGERTRVLHSMGLLPQHEMGFLPQDEQPGGAETAQRAEHDASQPAAEGRPPKATQPAAEEKPPEESEKVEIVQPPNFAELTEELAVAERLTDMISKCLKQLLMARGLKSMSAASNSAPPPALPTPAETPRGGTLQVVSSGPNAVKPSSSRRK